MKRIKLDGTMQSDLNWSQACELAEHAVNQGKRIFWELDLGLFSRLALPLSDQTQFLALGLSLEQFRDTIWPRFQEQTQGLCLYSDSLDFSQILHWNEELECNFQEWLDEKKLKAKNALVRALFCRDAVSDYLSLLRRRLPDELTVFLCFYADSISDSLWQLLLSHEECFPRMDIELRGGINVDPRASIAICLPPPSFCDPESYIGIQQALGFLIDKRISFRVIPETFLTAKWEGLDSLIVASSCVTSLGKRSLQGFCAAGGTIVLVESSLGLSTEVTFETWRVI